MRGTAIVAFLSLSLGVACTTPMEISFDARVDFSRYHSWDWLPDTARTLDVPTPYIVALDRDLARSVEREFEKRGLRRTRGGADLLIGALLNVRREIVTVVETSAVEYLSSHHASPGYEVQAVMKREETHERSRLVIFATDARLGHVVWRGALEERRRDRFSLHLARTVANLLQQFPPLTRFNGSPEPSRDPGAEDPTKFTASPSPSEHDV